MGYRRLTYPRLIASREFADYASATTVVVNKPPGLVAGDVLLAAACFGENGGSITGATGFTGSSTDGASSDVWVGYRVVDGSEGASWTWTCSAASWARHGRVLAFRGGSLVGTPQIGSTTTLPAETAKVGDLWVALVSACTTGNTSPPHITQPTSWHIEHRLSEYKTGDRHQSWCGMKHIASDGSTGTEALTIANTADALRRISCLLRPTRP